MTRVVKAHRVRVADVADRHGDALAVLAAEREAAQRAEVEAAYRAGLEDGRRAATEVGAGAVPALVAAVERAAATVERRAAVDRGVVVELALEVARWIAGRELRSDAGAVRERLDAALASIATTGALTVRVAPALVADVEAWLAGRAGAVVADAGLAPGEALLDVGDASVAFTIQGALDRARIVLRELELTDGEGGA